MHACMHMFWPRCSQATWLYVPVIFWHVHAYNRKTCFPFLETYRQPGIYHSICDSIYDRLCIPVYAPLLKMIFCSVVAIKRCYENLRRTHLEQQPGKEDFCKEQGLNRKYRSRRERVNYYVAQSFWISLQHSAEI